MKPPAPCGTYAAYQQHLRRKEPVDEACREASRAYVAEWRRADSPAVKQERVRDRARKRAMTRLARTHPDEYQALYAEELAAIRRTP